MYGVSVDTDGYEPFAKKGSTLIVSKDEEPISGDEVFIRYRLDNDSVHLIKRYIGTNEEKGVAIVAGLTSNEIEELMLARVELLDPIASIERPIVNRPVRLRPGTNQA